MMRSFMFLFCLLFAVSLCASAGGGGGGAGPLALVRGVWLWVGSFPIGILGRGGT